jgi:hypothetical protein
LVSTTRRVGRFPVSIPMIPCQKGEGEQVTVGGHLFPMSPPQRAVGRGTAENGPKPLGVDRVLRKTRFLEATARLLRAENSSG